MPIVQPYVLTASYLARNKSQYISEDHDPLFTSPWYRICWILVPFAMNNFGGVAMNFAAWCVQTKLKHHWVKSTISTRNWYLFRWLSLHCLVVSYWSPLWIGMRPISFFVFHDCRQQRNAATQSLEHETTPPQQQQLSYKIEIDIFKW